MANFTTDKPNAPSISNNNRKSNSDNKLATVTRSIGIVCIILGLAALAWSLLQSADFHSGTAQTSQTTGRVTDNSRRKLGKSSYECKISYTFTVSDNTYTSPSGGSDDDWSTKYCALTEGSSIPVSYSPADPTDNSYGEAITSDANAMSAMIAALPISMMLICVGVVIIKNAKEMNKSKAPEKAVEQGIVETAKSELDNR